MTQARRMVAPVVVVLACSVCTPPVLAAPADFPDMGSYPTVDATDYSPATGTWVFTVAGHGTRDARCQTWSDPERGVMCQYDPPNSHGHRVFVTASTSAAGAVNDEGPVLGPGAFPDLPPSTRIALPNGIDCVSPASDTIACLASPPPNAPAGATDVRGQPFSQHDLHGFIYNLTRTPTLF